MSWYKTGLISLTNGSKTVVGNATNFTKYVEVGEALLAPDGQHYEIATVVSSTELRLAKAYAGSTASAQQFAIIPVQGYVRDLAHKAADLIDLHKSVPESASGFADAAAASASSAGEFAANAEASSNTAVTKAAEASASAAAAAGTVTTVQNLASQAAASKETAESKAAAAGTSATQAAASAASASGSAEAAQNSAVESVNAATVSQTAKVAAENAIATVTAKATETLNNAAAAAESANAAATQATQANNSALNAQSSKEAAAASVASAWNYATAAASAASSAASTATTVTESANIAKSAANNASFSASTASTAATQATTAANDALASKTDAAAAAASAGASQTSAASSATAAAESATSAGASLAAIHELKESALDSKTRAAASADTATQKADSATAAAAAAEASKLAAKSSETAAAGSVASVLDSAAQALAHKNAASASADAAGASADAAAVSELASAMSQVAAESAEANAALSAASALNSQNAAAASQATAAQSEAAAVAAAASVGNIKAEGEAAVQKAMDWAEKMGGEVEPGKFSARYWAQIAQGAATGGVVYMGTWDASSGIYPATPENGHLYKVSVAGEVDGVSYSVKDMAIFNGTSWDKIDSTDEVTSVAGRVGAVVLDKTDVGLSNVDNTADLDKPVSAATALALAGKEATIPASNEAQYYAGNKTWKSFAASVRDALLDGFSGATGTVVSATDTVLSAIGKLQRQVTDNLTALTNHASDKSNPHGVTKGQLGLGSVDNTADIDKPVSAAVSSALGTKAPLAHSHSISDVTGLSGQLSDKLPKTGGQIDGSLEFTGTGRRIRADFSNPTIANRASFQTATVDGATRIQAIPNGTSKNAEVGVCNSSDPTNASWMQLVIGDAETSVASVSSGTGALLPMSFYTGGARRFQIDTGGNLLVSSGDPFGKVTVKSNFGDGRAPNLALETTSSAQGLLAGISFRPTFTGTLDNGGRRAADIWSGFNGSWGGEFLSFGVGRNSASNDANLTTIERVRIDGLGRTNFLGGITEKQVPINTEINLALGSLFTKTMSGATVLTVTNVPASGVVASFVLELINGGSAGITWWANVKWAGGTAPTLTASGRDVLGFFTYNGGATWTGLLLGKDVK